MVPNVSLDEAQFDMIFFFWSGFEGGGKNKAFTYFAFFF